MKDARRPVIAAAGLGALLVCAGMALAQAPGVPAAAPAAPQAAAPATTPAGQPAYRLTGNPQRDTLVRMMRPVTINLRDQRLEDAMRFITDVTGAEIEVMWTDDRTSDGWDKDETITLDFPGGSALSLVERIADKASGGGVGAASSTWQMSESGTLQIGPKSRLNRWKRVVLYPINDMLVELPRYADAPELDLQNVLQQSGQGGGGGGRSPFEQPDDDEIDRQSPAEKATEIIEILQQLVESEQWVDNGGEGGSMRFFQGSLIVNAPDYMHRQLNGYPYWPQSATRVAMAKGRRYVSLGMDSSLAKVVGFENQPVTAVVGGRLVRSGGGPGGQAPAPAAPETPAAPPK
jgi:hypothetical protein